MPGNLSLERSGGKIIGFHSRNLRSWAQLVSNLRYSNPIVIQMSHFYDHKFTMLNPLIQRKTERVREDASGDSEDNELPCVIGESAGDCV